MILQAANLKWYYFTGKKPQLYDLEATHLNLYDFTGNKLQYSKSNMVLQAQTKSHKVLKFQKFN